MKLSPYASLNRAERLQQRELLSVGIYIRWKANAICIEGNPLFSSWSFKWVCCSLFRYVPVSYRIGWYTKCNFNCFESLNARVEVRSFEEVNRSWEGNYSIICSSYKDLIASSFAKLQIFWGMDILYLLRQLPHEQRPRTLRNPCHSYSAVVDSDPRIRITMLCIQ